METNTNTTEKPAFKVLGVNDDSDTCDCCGKTGLKKVVWIEETLSGAINKFGVVCAANPAKAFGLKSEIKSAESGWKRTLDHAWRLAHAEYRKAGGKYQSNGIPLNEGGGVEATDKEQIAALFAAAMVKAKEYSRQLAEYNAKRAEK